MADTKISAETTGTTPAVGDEFRIARSGANYKLTWSQMCGNITASGAVGITPASGSNLNVTLATTGDLAVNTNHLYVDTSAGNVGIGTTTPYAKLDVNSTGTALNVYDATTSNIRLSIGTAGSPNYRAFLQTYQHNNSSVSGNLTLQESGGNVGIGTASPDAKLHIQSGDLKVVGSGGNSISFSNGQAIQADGQLYIDSGAAADIHFRPDVNESMLLTVAGNTKIGGTAVRGTTEGTKHLDIFDGAAPVGTLANGISLYSTAGELRVMDAAGNATLLSPHDSVTNEWIFDSVQSVTGKRLRIDVERILRFIDQKYGLNAVMEEMQ